MTSRWVSLCRRVLALGCLGTIVCMSGCGPSKGTVSGKVTYQGKTIVFGSVNGSDGAGNSFNVAIQPDGTYSVPDLIVGDAKFGVSSPDPTKYFAQVIALQRTDEGKNQAKAEAAKVDRTKWFPIPETYIQPETSGLTFKITGAQNTYNIDLK